jgi:type II secretory pathway component PulK
MISPDATSGPSYARHRRRSTGIVLAIVLVLIFVLVTAVYGFQRRAIIDTSIAKNRLRSAEADALARGGLRIAEAVLFLARLKNEAGSAGSGQASIGDLTSSPAGGLPLPDELWASMGAYPLELADGQSLRISIEDEGARLNLNALVNPKDSPDEESDEEAEEYLRRVLDYIIDGQADSANDKKYDTRALARNLLDYIDADDIARNGRNEDSYYASQDPPYRASNRPFLSFEEIGLVEGIDPPLLKAMRDYVTVHPIGGRQGINLNRAEPWVLAIVYAGTSGDRELVREGTVRDIWALRQKKKIICSEVAADPVRCVALNEVGNGDLAEGSIYPESLLPAQPIVFRAVAEARVGNITRRLEAVYDTRPLERPQLLSWRRLRGPE